MDRTINIKDNSFDILRGGLAYDITVFEEIF